MAVSCQATASVATALLPVYQSSVQVYHISPRVLGNAHAASCARADDYSFLRTIAAKYAAHSPVERCKMVTGSKGYGPGSMRNAAVYQPASCLNDYS